MVNIVELKRKIQKLENKTSNDEEVLSIVDSFWGCSDLWIKAKLAGRIAKYAGCEAWKIVMDYVYIGK